METGDALALGAFFGGLAPPVVALLFAAAFATAILSATIGVAGGITLLAVMLLFLDPLVAIPLHGVVQLVSNSSRAWMLRPHVRLDVVGRYSILLLPFGALGIGLAQSLSPHVLRAAIGVFVLLATWRPQWLLLGARPENVDPHRRFFVLGGVIGFVNVSIGATGPLLAPFFLNLGLTRFAIIGTQAACQMLGHLSKIVVFGAAGFTFREWLGLLGLLSIAAVAGTRVGGLLLERVNERVFRALYKGVLTLIALRLVAAELLA
ncbi:MAG: sulfite exporter TauE/SafE family protein [Myxococcales bacterium]|nr:sulfite exporter TauE/SafE family protein [Myxococcales bacterium]